MFLQLEDKMKSEILDVGDVPLNDELYVKKGIFGYRVVNPTRDKHGKIIWVNLLIGGWGNFLKLLFILFVIGCFLYGFHEVTEGCKDLAENPCAYTNLDCSTSTGDNFKGFEQIIGEGDIDEG